MATNANEIEAGRLTIPIVVALEQLDRDFEAVDRKAAEAGTKTAASFKSQFAAGTADVSAQLEAPMRQAAAEVGRSSLGEVDKVINAAKAKAARAMGELGKELRAGAVSPAEFVAQGNQIGENLARGILDGAQRLAGRGLISPEHLAALTVQFDNAGARDGAAYMDAVLEAIRSAGQIAAPLNAAAPQNADDLIRAVREAQAAAQAAPVTIPAVVDSSTVPASVQRAADEAQQTLEAAGPAEIPVAPVPAGDPAAVGRQIAQDAQQGAQAVGPVRVPVAPPAGGEEAGRVTAEQFSTAFNTSIESMAQGLAPRFERMLSGLSPAGAQAVDRLYTVMSQRAAGQMERLGQQLAAGTISPEEFEAKGEEVARRLRGAIETGVGRLELRGVLSEEEAVSVIGSGYSIGQRIGERMLEGARDAAGGGVSLPIQDSSAEAGTVGARAGASFAERFQSAATATAGRAAEDLAHALERAGIDFGSEVGEKVGDMVGRAMQSAQQKLADLGNLDFTGGDFDQQGQRIAAEFAQGVSAGLLRMRDAGDITEEQFQSLQGRMAEIGRVGGADLVENARTAASAAARQAPVELPVQVAAADTAQGVAQAVDQAQRVAESAPVVLPTEVDPAGASAGVQGAAAQAQTQVPDLRLPLTADTHQAAIELDAFYTRFDEGAAVATDRMQRTLTRGFGWFSGIGAKIGQPIVDGIQGAMDRAGQTVQDAGAELAEKAISPEEFKSRGQLAASNLVAEIHRILTQARDVGDITAQQFEDLAPRMAQMGREAGDALITGAMDGVKTATGVAVTIPVGASTEAVVPEVEKGVEKAKAVAAGSKVKVPFELDTSAVLAGADETTRRVDELVTAAMREVEAKQAQMSESARARAVRNAEGTSKAVADAYVAQQRVGLTAQQNALRDAVHTGALSPKEATRKSAEYWREYVREAKSQLSRLEDAGVRGPQLQAINAAVMKDIAKGAGFAKTRINELGQEATMVGRALEYMGRRFKFMVAVAALGMISGLVRSIRGLRGEFTEFDDVMIRSTAIMRGVGAAMREEMGQRAAAEARRLGIAAKDVAESYYYLAAAGMNAQQSMAALPVVMNFSKAAVMDAKRATDLLTDSQMALGRSSDDAATNQRELARISDILVNANTQANASAEQFAEALTNKGGAALRLVNKDLTEGIGILAVYANQGLKGAAAGEAMSIMLRDLQRAAVRNAGAFKQNEIAVFDHNNRMRNSADIIGDLEKRMATMSDRSRRVLLMNLGFQDRSINSLVRLIGYSQDMTRYQKEAADATSATARVVASQMESFEQRQGRVAEKWETVKRRAGEALLPISEWIMKGTDALLDRFIPALDRIIDKMVDLGLANEDVLVMQLGRQAEKAAEHLAKMQRALATQQATADRSVAGQIVGGARRLVGALPGIPDYEPPKTDLSTMDEDTARRNLNEKIGEGSRVVSQLKNATAEERVEALERLRVIQMEIADYGRRVGMFEESKKAQEDLLQIEEDIGKAYADQRIQRSITAMSDRGAELRRMAADTLRAAAAQMELNAQVSSMGGGMTAGQMREVQQQARERAEEMQRQAAFYERTAADMEKRRTAPLKKTGTDPTEAELELEKNRREQSAKEMETALKKINQRLREYNTLTRAGVSPFDQPADNLLASLRQVVALESDIVALQEEIAKARGKAPAQVQELLNAMRQQQRMLEARIEFSINTGPALRAIAGVQRAAADLRLGVTTDPAELRAALDEYDRLVAENPAMLALLPEDVRAGIGELRDRLRAEVLTVTVTAEVQMAPVAGLMDTVEDVLARDDLSVEVRSELEPLTGDLAVLRREVENWRAGLTVDTAGATAAFQRLAAFVERTDLSAEVQTVLTPLAPQLSAARATLRSAGLAVPVGIVMDDMAPHLRRQQAFMDANPLSLKIRLDDFLTGLGAATDRIDSMLAGVSRAGAQSMRAPVDAVLAAASSRAAAMEAASRAAEGPDVRAQAETRRALARAEEDYARTVRESADAIRQLIAVGEVREDVGLRVIGQLRATVEADATAITDVLTELQERASSSVTAGFETFAAGMERVGEAQGRLAAAQREVAAAAATTDVNRQTAARQELSAAQREMADTANAYIRSLEGAGLGVAELNALMADLKRVLDAAGVSMDDLAARTRAGITFAFRGSRIAADEAVEMAQAVARGAIAARDEFNRLDAEQPGSKAAREARAEMVRTRREATRTINAIAIALGRAVASGALTPGQVESVLGPIKVEAEEAGVEIKNAEGKASALVSTLGQIEGMARGILSVADAMGTLDDQTRRTLQGVIDLAGGITKLIANPADIGAWAQSIGGAIGVIQGMFGKNKAKDDAARQLLLRNMEATYQNTLALKALTGAVLSDITASERAGIEKGREGFEGKFDEAFRMIEQTRRERGIDPNTPMALKPKNLSQADFEYLRRLEEITGMEFFDETTGEFILGRYREAVEQFKNLDLGSFGKGLDGRLEALSFMFANAGDSIGDAAAKMRLWINAVREFSPQFAEEFERRIREQGPAAAKAWLEEQARAFAETGLPEGGGIFGPDVTADQVQRILEGAFERIEDFSGAFAAAMAALQTEFEVFDIKKPVDRLRRLREEISNFLSEDLAAELQRIDVTTVEGRAAFEAALKQIYSQMQAGSLDVAKLGSLTPEEMTQAITDLLKETRAAMADAGDTKGFSVERGITETTAGRLASILTTIAYWSEATARMMADLLTAVTGVEFTLPEALPVGGLPLDISILETQMRELIELQTPDEARQAVALLRQILATMAEDVAARTELPPPAKREETEAPERPRRPEPERERDPMEGVVPRPPREERIVEPVLEVRPNVNLNVTPEVEITLEAPAAGQPAATTPPILPELLPPPVSSREGEVPTVGMSPVVEVLERILDEVSEPLDVDEQIERLLRSLPAPGPLPMPLEVAPGPERAANRQGLPEADYALALRDAARAFEMAVVQDAITAAELRRIAPALLESQAGPGDYATPVRVRQPEPAALLPSARGGYAETRHVNLSGRIDFSTLRVDLHSTGGVVDPDSIEEATLVLSRETARQMDRMLQERVREIERAMGKR